MSTSEKRRTGGGPREPTDWERAAAARVADLRMRLLDLKNSNRLLNFKFTERSRSHVRVNEASSDAIFANLVEGKRLAFHALPEKSDEPPDEKSDQFLMALEQARNSDSVYREELEALEDDPDGEETRFLTVRIIFECFEFLAVHRIRISCLLEGHKKLIALFIRRLVGLLWEGMKRKAFPLDK